MKRIYNFNAGPAMLPLEVLQEVQSELLDLQGSGMSILEMSHRAPIYEKSMLRRKPTSRSFWVWATIIAYSLWEAAPACSFRWCR